MTMYNVFQMLYFQQVLSLHRIFNLQNYCYIIFYMIFFVELLFQTQLLHIFLQY